MAEQLITAHRFESVGYPQGHLCGVLVNGRPCAYPSVMHKPTEQPTTPRPAAEEATPRRLWKISNYRPFGIIERDPAESTYEWGDDKFPIIVGVRGSLIEQKERAELIVSAVNAYSPARDAAAEQMYEAATFARNRLLQDSGDQESIDKLNRAITSYEAMKNEDRN